MSDATGIIEFQRCDRRRCHYIGIVDSVMLEEEETFDLSLLRNGLDSAISLSQTLTTITIIDDDGTCESD